MSAQSEPEKYSIDEMMERLKNRPAEDPLEQGELVTRADGSQAIRVRKRKRRSHQPHKEERIQQRRARMVQVSAALILLLLALFAAGAAIVFANSAPFRENLVKKISQSSGAGAELQGFRMNPTSANANGLTLRWPEGNVLRDLTLRQIRAEIFPVSFLGKIMTGEEASAQEGTLTLRFPQAGKPACDTPIPAGPPPVRFKRYAIPKLHVLLGDASAPLARMTNCEGSFQPVHAGTRPLLLLTRGDLAVEGWPKLKMDRSHIEFRGSEVDIIGMRLRYDTDSRGVFELAGTVSPYNTDRESTLSVGFDSYQLAGIAGPELGRLFSGRIDSRASAKSNYLTFKPGASPDASLVAEFQKSVTSSFEISGFPFLKELSTVLDEKWFERPVFDNDASGVVRRFDGKVTLGALHFENKDRMALRGSLTMGRDRRLDGEFEVGLAEALVKVSANRTALDALFGEPKDGFRWLTLRVGGTAGNPADNFREQFEAAAAAARETRPSGGAPSFEDLTRPR